MKGGDGIAPDQGMICAAAVLGWVGMVSGRISGEFGFYTLLLIPIYTLVIYTICDFSDFIFRTFCSFQTFGPSHAAFDTDM